MKNKIAGSCGGRLIIAALFLLIAVVATRVALAQIAPASKGSPAFPLKVSSNGRYLVDQNDAPFLLCGDVPQVIVTMASTGQAARFFAEREAQGFNAMWIDVLVAGPYYPESPNNGSTYDGILPFSGYTHGVRDTAHYDLNRPNNAYFERVDQMLALASQHRLVVFLDPIETGQWRPTLRNNGRAAAERYGRFLGSRYKHFHNIVWFNGNDFNSWKNPVDDALVQAVARGIRETDPGSLQTVELNVETSSSFDDPTWVPLTQLNGTYTYSATYIQMLHSYNQTPVAPTFLMEAHYEFDNIGKPVDFGNPEVLRREEYWTMLSGGKGQLYGSSYGWTFMPGWQLYVDSPGVMQLRIWKHFFSSLPWQNLVPDQDHNVVTAGLGTFGSLQTAVSKSDFCTASRTPDGSFVIAYMPTMREITVDMASLRAPAMARWFDPTNGVYTAVAGGRLSNHGEHNFTPPGRNHDGNGDWVLVLDASSSTPAP